MCGIIGVVMQRGTDVTEIILQCLKKLEYRGNDSAGMAVWHEAQGLQRLRSMGKADDLSAKYRATPIQGNIGIAHTRWATHGKPSEENAHPHISSDSIALVQNGIIENYEELRADLLTKGYIFTSETDTEVVAHLLHNEYTNSTDKNFLSAVQKIVAKLQGSFALVILNKEFPDRLIAVRCGNPLVVGIGENGNFIASDTISIMSLTDKFVYLEDEDIAEIKATQVTFYDKNLSIVDREIKSCPLSSNSADKGKYKYYMQKEIFEQPLVVKDTIASDFENLSTYIANIRDKIKRLTIVACGSSYYAAMVGRYWMEELTGLACNVEIASEFRYRTVAVEEGTLFVTISQSGETADTLAALRKVQKLPKCEGYIGNLAICNVEESSLVRESDISFITKAGVEIGVASTKAFTSQLAALFLLSLTLMPTSPANNNKKNRLLHNLRQLPFLMEQVIMLDTRMQQLAKNLINKEHMFFLGRGISYPIALEGALKMKEISYLHAEAYPAGELKHGTLALIVEGIPVIVLAPNDNTFEKTKSNINEVASRGGELIIFTDSHVSVSGNNDKITIIKMPTLIPELAPLLYVIPLQLLAYHVADLRGNNVDQPRNLAKSVTVE